LRKKRLESTKLAVIDARKDIMVATDLPRQLAVLTPRAGLSVYQRNDRLALTQRSMPTVFQSPATSLLVDARAMVGFQRFSPLALMPSV
jgi:hypothetical protein